MPSRRPLPRASAHRIRLLGAALLSASLGVSAGCYSSRPIMSAPEPGGIAVVTLNDRGRAALSDAVGANAERVEGSVVTRTDSSFTLAIRSVAYFGGTTNSWRGEQVTVPVAGVRGMTERRLSKGRTYLAIGVGVAALVAFIVTRSVLADDRGFVEDTPDSPPAGGSFVPVRP